MTTSASLPHPARVLVTGATGKTGRRVAATLRGQGIAVRAASRNSVQPAERFDWDNDRTWDPSLAGVDAVYLTYQPDLAAPGAPQRIGRLAERIADAGISRVVLLSGRGEPAAQVSETALLSVIETATVLRCSWFDQNFTEGALRDPVLAGVVALPAPAERTEPFIDAEDIAACAAVALTEPGHAGQVYELTGPDAVPLADVADILSRCLGRPVDYLPASEEEFAAQLAAEGVPYEDATALAAVFGAVLDGRNSSPADGVPRLLGRPGTSFADFARDAASAGAWEQTVEVSR